MLEVRKKSFLETLVDGSSLTLSLTRFHEAKQIMRSIGKCICVISTIKLRKHDHLQVSYITSNLLNKKATLMNMICLQIPEQIRTLQKFPRVFEKKLSWKEWKHSYKVWTSFVVSLKC